MSDQLKSIAFTAIVALICSLLLTGAATGLKDRKLRNVAVDRQKNILKSVGLIDDAEATTVDQIERLYAETIRCMGVDGAGNIVADLSGRDALPVCFYIREERPSAYILPVDSHGLWG